MKGGANGDESFRGRDELSAAIVATLRCLYKSCSLLLLVQIVAMAGGSIVCRDALTLLQV